MYLPLNLIPGIGTLLFIILQGQRFGPSAHLRFFQLKGWSNTQREEFIAQHRGAYTRYVLYIFEKRAYHCRYRFTPSHATALTLFSSFGIPAALLETIPLAQVLFAFTNNVGAALWAADLEDRSTTAPGLRQQAKKAR